MKKTRLFFYLMLTSLIFVGSVKAHVELDYPFGGEILEVGETVNIEWHIIIYHNLENWDLYFSSDGGTNWEVIQLDLQASQLDYQWTVPSVATEQARIRIYMDNAEEDYEDISANFTINETTTSVRILEENPLIFGLNSNYPNPFNPSTKIEYSIPTSGFVTLRVYDAIGRNVQTLISEYQEANYYSVIFDASNLSSGIYFYRLKVGKNFVDTKKMLYLR